MDPRPRPSALELVGELLEQPEEARAAALARLAEEDPELAREVASLLAADAEDPAFLRPASARELASALDAGEADDWIGRAVGPYRIERRVAAGGMGVVYLAVRSDGQFEQRVAVKLIKRGMDTEAILERFARERRVLATLEHEGIARILDGGALDDGRPFLVMEYVEGDPIDRYCAVRGLDLDARLELFVAVCRAVEHAHQRLVLHRDIKPGNVLVTPDGRPKLLDFGLAKVVAPEGGAESFDLTSAGERLLTPDYAAPEQLRGEPSTTATDVYSLGVMLYELLAGRRPYALGELGWAELERLVCQVDPPLPSRAVEPESGTRARRLAGDLDTIVATALRKEPERRYPSVAALAADVQRHLSGHPVAARPDSFAYRATKFVRRNRVLTGAVLLAVLSLVGATAVSAVSGQRARRAEAAERGARERADARLQDALDASFALVFEFADGIARLQGSTELRLGLLRAAFARLEALEDEARARPENALALGRAYLKLAQVQADTYSAAVGDLDGAARSYARAEDLLGGVDAEAPGARRAWCTLEKRLGDRDKDAGDLAAALVHYERAAELAEAEVAQDPADPGLREWLLGRRLDLGSALGLLDETERAGALFEAALEDCRALLAERPGDPGLRWSEVQALSGVAATVFKSASPADSVPIWDDLLARLDRLVADAPGLRAPLAARVYHRTSATQALIHAGELERALDELELGLSYADALAEADPLDVQPRRWIANLLHNVGWAHQERARGERAAGGSPDRARAALEAARDALAESGARWEELAREGRLLGYEGDYAERVAARLADVQRELEPE